MSDERRVDELRSALESMCEQYLTFGRDDPDFHHMFMSAGEEACEVLCRLFPDRWVATGDGAARVRS